MLPTIDGSFLKKETFLDVLSSEFFSFCFHRRRIILLDTCPMLIQKKFGRPFRDRSAPNKSAYGLVCANRPT